MTANIASLLAAEPSSYMTSGDASADTLRRKRRLAEVLAAQGSDFSPVQHPMQGFARVANALVGGLEMRQIDAEERRREKGVADTLVALPGLGGGMLAAGPSPAAAAQPDPSVPSTMSPAGRSDPRGFRNNNPLNIEAGPFTAGKEGFSGSDGRFAKFGSMDQGIGAADQLLQVYAGKHGLNTVAGIIGRWAPSTDGNNVSAYAANVSRQMGVDPTAPLDMSNPEVRQGLIRAMAQHENGRALPQQVAALPPATMTDAGTGPAPAAPAAAGPQVAQARPGAPVSPAAPAGGLPPQEAAYIRALVANPQTRQYGMQLYQAAQARANQPQYGFQATPDGTIIRTDQRRGTVEPIYQAPSKPTFAEVGTDPQTGQPLRGFVDPVKREVQPYTPPNAQAAGPSTIPPVPAGVDPKVWHEAHSKNAVAGALPPKFDDVAQVRKEIQQLPSYKNHAQAAPIYKTMVDAAPRNTRASDLNLVYGLGKIFDPGSVVREGEMVMVKNTAGLPDWLVGSINALNGGAALTQKTRNAIMQEAYSRMKSYEDVFDYDTEHYKGIAGRARMNAEDVIPPLRRADAWRAMAETEPDGSVVSPAAAAPAPPIASPKAPEAAPDADGWRPGPGGVRIREKR
jgi:hypothetical protein